MVSLVENANSYQLGRRGQRPPTIPHQHDSLPPGCVTEQSPYQKMAMGGGSPAAGPRRTASYSPRRRPPARSETALVHHPPRPPYPARALQLSPNVTSGAPTPLSSPHKFSALYLATNENKTQTSPAVAYLHASLAAQQFEDHLRAEHSASVRQCSLGLERRGQPGATPARVTHLANAGGYDEKVPVPPLQLAQQRREACTQPCTGASAGRCLRATS